MDLKGSHIDDEEEKIYCKLEARKTRRKIIEIINILELDDDFLIRSDLKWIYATLANCHLALNNIADFEKNETLFMEKSPLDWELETYNDSKTNIQNLNN